MLVNELQFWVVFFFSSLVFDFEFLVDASCGFKWVILQHKQVLIHLFSTDFEELPKEVVTDMLQVFVLFVGIVQSKDDLQQLVCDEVEGLAKACAQRELLFSLVHLYFHRVVRLLLAPRAVDFVPFMLTEALFRTSKDFEDVFLCEHL